MKQTNQKQNRQLYGQGYEVIVLNFYQATLYVGAVYATVVRSCHVCLPVATFTSRELYQNS